MNGPEHYREAERLLAKASTTPDGIKFHRMLVAEAQVHATLALFVAPVEITLSGGAPVHPAPLTPAPKGFQCAAGCRHSISVHREAGCDVDGCDCPAPFGRLMPQPDVPDDASGITDVTS